MHELAVAAAGERDPGRLAKLCVTHVAALLRADSATLYWHVPENARLEPLATNDGGVLDFRPIELGDGATGAAFVADAPVVVDDYPSWRNSLSSVVQRGVRTAAAVPLRVGERPLGVIVATRVRPEAFSQEDVQVLVTLSAQVAPAIRSALLVAEAERKARQLEVLHRVSVEAASSLQLEQLAGLAVDRATELTGGVSATLVWLQPDGSVKVLADNNLEQFPEATSTVSNGAGEQAMSSAGAVVIDDYPGWEHALPWAIQAGFQSIAALPLMVRDRASGALIVRSDESHHFTDEHVRLLTLLAAQIAPLVEAARLLGASIGQAERLRGLHELAVAAGGVLDESRLAQLAVDECAWLVGAEAVGLALYQEETGKLHNVANTMLSDTDPVAPGVGATGIAFERREPLVVNDYQGWEHTPDRGRRQGWQSVAAVPLLVGNRAIGALFACMRNGHLDAEAVEMMTLLAAQVAPAVVAARHAREREADTQALAVLREIAIAGLGETDSESFVSRAAEAARRLVGADNAVVVLWDENEQVLRRVHETKPGLSRETFVPGEGGMGTAFSRGEVMAIEDYLSRPDASESAHRAGVRSMLTAPILRDDRVVGTLGLAFLKGRVFQERDVNLISVLGAQIGRQLEAVERAREREEEARRLRILHEAASVAAGILDPKELADRIIGVTRALLETEGAALWWWDEASGSLEVVADSFPEGQGRRVDPHLGSSGAVGEVYRSREPLVVNGYEGWPLAMPWVVELGVHATLAVPLLVRDRVSGAITVASLDPKRQFDEDDVRLLQLAGAQLAPAFDAARLHAELAESERRLRALFDSSPFVIVRHALDGTVLEVSPAVRTLFGREPEELVGQPRLSAFPRDSDDSGPNFDRLARGEIELYSSERVYPRADGSRFWGLATIRLIRDSRGKPASVLAIVQDVSERKRAAEEAERRAATFQALHEVATAAAGILEPKQLADIASAKAAELLGTRGAYVFWGEPDGKRLRVLSDVEFPDNEDDIIPATRGRGGIACTTGRPVIENDYLRATFALRNALRHKVRAAASVPLIVQDRVVGALGVVAYDERRFDESDVALLSLLAAEIAPAMEAARLHAGLRRSEAEIRALFDSAPIGIARVSPDLRLLSMNARAEEITGLTFEALQGQDMSRLFRSPDRSRTLRPFQGTSELERFELMFSRPDGGSAVVEVRLVPVRDRNGKVEFVTAMVEDIAERKQAAAELEQRAETFRALHEVASAASGVLEPNVLEDLAAVTAARLTRAAGAWLGSFDEHGQLIVVSDTDDPERIGFAISSGSGVGGRVAQEGRAVIVNQYQTVAGMLERSLDHGVTAAAGVPLLHHDKLVGVLGVRRYDGHAFTADDTGLLELIASIIAPALEAARLHADLARSAAEIQAFFDTAPVGVFHIATDGRILAMNRMAEQISGWKAAERVGQVLEGKPQHPETIEVFSGRREFFQMQQEIVRPDGRRLQCELRMAPVRGASGDVEFVTVMVTDVSERRRAEKALLESEARKRAIVESALDCIIATDSQGRVIEFNPAAERTLGYAREEAIGRRIYQLIVPKRLAARHRQAFARALQAGAPAGVRFETVARRKDGSELPVEMALSSFVDAGEAMLSVSIRDLSERARADEALRESQSKSRFVAAMSHELRTPLNSIIGFAQLLNSSAPGQLTDRQQRYVGHIETSGRHLLSLINDVLDISKVAAGQIEVEPKDFEVGPLLEEAADQIRPLAERNSLQLEVSLEKPLQAHADRRRVLQVLINLLGNAVKFTPEGGRIEVKALARRARIRISVHDNGVGIAEADQERIFDEFTRLESAENGNVDGTGLGLALSRRLLNLMGGSINVSSKLGEGATFTVELPSAVRSGSSR